MNADEARKTYGPNYEAIQADQRLEAARRLIVGRNVKACRRRVGLTQEEFAARLRTVKEVIVEAENGRRALSTDLLFRIADAANVEVSALFSDPAIPHKAPS